MSFGKMNTRITFYDKLTETDDEGFNNEIEVWLKEIRAYREGRHGTEKWANRAAFTDATDLFRFRVIPNTGITNDMQILCDGREFQITSIENVKGRGMYLEVLAKEVASGG